MGWKDRAISADAPAASGWRARAVSAGSEKPAPEEPPGLMARAAKWLGETGADAVTGAQEMLSFADPAVAAAGALGSYAVPYTAPEGATLGERFKNEMEALRARREESHKRSPTATMAGGVGMGAAALPAALESLPSMSRVVQNGPLLARAMAGAGDAALFNSGSAALSNVDRDPVGAASQAAQSPMNLLGAVIPVAAEAVPVARAGLARTVAKMTPRVTPTKAAQLLLKENVPLTTGQMNPETAAAQIEETATSLPGVGPGIKNKRDAAMEAWRDAALKKGLPPEAPLSPDATAEEKAAAAELRARMERGSVPERLKAMYEGFDPAYKAISSEELYPAIHRNGRGTPLQGTKNTPGAFDSAVADPGVLATAEDRAIVKRFLDNQLSLLPGGTDRPGMVGKVGADRLLEMRANIRKAASDASLSNKHEIAALLDNAQQAVGDAVASQLGPEPAAKLNEADKQYSIYKKLEDASTRAGLSGEFTPSHLGASLLKSAGRANFARGGGGELRDLAGAGKEVFDARVPLTGARLVAELPAWAGGKLLHGALATGINSEAGRAMLLGQQLRAPEVPGMVPPTMAPSLVRALSSDASSPPRLRLVAEEDQKKRSQLAQLLMDHPELAGGTP